MVRMNWARHKWPITVFYVLGCSLNPIGLRYLTFHFDTFTQNFYRFVSGELALLTIGLIWHRRELARLLRDGRRLGAISVLALSLAFSQYCYIEGLSRTSAVMGQLIGIFALPLTILCTVWLFADERDMVRGRGFWVGGALAIAGTLGLAFSRADQDLGYSVGVLFLIGSTLMNVLFFVLTKRLVRASQPICVGAILTGMQCVIYLFVGLLWGDLAKVCGVPVHTDVILALSGTYGILFGVALGFFFIREYGVIFSNFASLVIPVFTGVQGYLWFRERLTGAQLACSALLMFGSYLILRRKRERMRAARDS